VALVGETGDAVKAARSELMKHTLGESSVAVPRRKQKEAFEQYQTDRAQGSERTELLQQAVKDALEANRKAHEELQTRTSPTGSTAVNSRRTGQADLRRFMSPKPARELQAEFAAASGQEGPEERKEAGESQHGYSA